MNLDNNMKVEDLYSHQFYLGSCRQIRSSLVLKRLDKNFVPDLPKESMKKNFILDPRKHLNNFDIIRYHIQLQYLLMII